MPKFLGWSERILEANPAGADHLVGSSVTYTDLSLFQLIEGLRFAFPLASERELAKLPRVTALHKAVAERPRLKAYLASGRRPPRAPSREPCGSRPRPQGVSVESELATPGRTP